MSRLKWLVSALMRLAVRLKLVNPPLPSSAELSSKSSAPLPPGLSVLGTALEKQMLGLSQQLNHTPGPWQTPKVTNSPITDALMTLLDAFAQSGHSSRPDGEDPVLELPRDLYAAVVHETMRMRTFQSSETSQAMSGHLAVQGLSHILRITTKPMQVIKVPHMSPEQLERFKKEMLKVSDSTWRMPIFNGDAAIETLHQEPDGTLRTPEEHKRWEEAKAAAEAAKKAEEERVRKELEERAAQLKARKEEADW